MKLLTGLQRLNVCSASGCADVLFFLLLEKTGKATSGAEE